MTSVPLYNDPPALLFNKRSAAADESLDAAAIAETITNYLSACEAKELQSLPVKQQQDVQTRVKALLSALEAGTISAPILERLSDMSVALKKSDYAVANKVHIEIITAFYDESSYWILGLKRLLALSMASSA